MEAEWQALAKSIQREVARLDIADQRKRKYDHSNRIINCHHHTRNTTYVYPHYYHYQPLPVQSMAQNSNCLQTCNV